MAQLLPPSFLFAPILDAAKLNTWPKSATGELWEELTAIPGLSAMDEGKPRIEVRLGWHAEGLLVGVQACEKAEPPRAEPLYHENDDRFVIGIDTRDTKTIHRAGRFCHRFHLTPCDEDGELDPSLSAEVIPRATEDAPLASFTSADIAAERTDDGYRIVARLRAASLNGYDPEFSDRIGLHVELSDREHGSVPILGDARMSNAADPSLWASVRFVSEK